MTSLVDRLFKVKRGEILTPLVDDYFRQHEGALFSGDTMAVLSALATRRPRIRSGSFSASSLGKCMRKQMFSALAFPEYGSIGPRQKRLFADGHWRHLFWQGVFLEMGLVEYVNGQPMLEYGMFAPNLGLRGTLDCVLTLQGERTIVDIKGANNFSFSKAKEGRADVAYRWQLQSYMHVLGIKRAMLFYEAKETQETCEILLHHNDAEAQEALLRARGLKRHWDRHILPPRLGSYPFAYECKQCPFVDSCKNEGWTTQYLELDEAV